MLQVDAMPICGLLKSSFLKPVGYNKRGSALALRHRQPDYYVGPFVRHEVFLLKLKGLLQHGRTALPVVQRLFAAGQRFYVRWREAMTNKPLLSLGCQYK